MLHSSALRPRGFVFGGALGACALSLLLFAATHADTKPAGAERRGRQDDTLRLELVAQYGGSVEDAAVATDGSYGYAGMGPRLVVLDLSEAASPLPVGHSEVLTGIVTMVAVGDRAALVGVASLGALRNQYFGDATETIRVLDISDPARPSARGTYASPAYIRDLAVSEGLAFVAAGPAGVRILDVHDVDHPLEAAAVEIPAVAVAAGPGRTALILSSYGTLYSIDASDPWHPIVVSWLVLPTADPHRLSASHGLAVAGGSDGLAVIDVGDPSDLKIVQTLETADQVHDVDIHGSGGYAILGGWYCVPPTVRALDLAEPDSPSLGSEVLWTHGYRLSVSGGRLLIAERYAGLRVADATGPGELRSVSSLGVAGEAQAVDVEGAYGYVANRTGGLHVLDLTEEHASSPMARASAANAPPDGFLAAQADVQVENGLAYIAQCQNCESAWSGLQIVDVGDPLRPVQRAEAHLEWMDDGCPGNAEAVAVAGTTAYVGDRLCGGVHVVDMSDATAPVRTVHFEPGRHQYLTDVAVDGNRLYCTNRGGQLKIADVSDALHPRHIGSFSQPGQALALDAAGGFAYIAGGPDGVVVVDVADPSAPLRAASFSDIEAVQLELAGDRLLVVGTAPEDDPLHGKAFLLVLDVATPAQPVELTRVGLPGGGRITVVAETVYVAALQGGVLAFRMAPGGDAASPTPVVTATATAGRSTCPASAIKVAQPATVVLGDDVRVGLHPTVLCPAQMGGLHLVLVLDASGSMAGSPNRAMKKAASQLVRDLNLSSSPATRVGIVAYSSEALALTELTSAEAAAIAAIDMIGALGGSNLSGGITVGLEVLAAGRPLPSGRASTEAMVVLGDGGNNSGCPPVLQAAERAKNQGIAVYAVCVGQGCEPECLEQAATSPSHFYRVESAGELGVVLPQLAADSGLLTIPDLTIVDELPGNMRYVPGSAEPGPDVVSPAANRLEWRFKFVPPGGISITYNVEPLEKGNHATNVEATGRFTDWAGRLGSLSFPVPQVNVLIPPPTPTATASPTAAPSPHLTAVPQCVCTNVRDRVPMVVIADALANPDRYYGWQDPLNPGVPPGPGNPLRECLSLANGGLDYHPLWNKPMWRVGCP